MKKLIIILFLLIPSLVKAEAQIKQIQELKIKKKNEEMEKIKELQKQLEEMNKNLDNLG